MTALANFRPNVFTTRPGLLGRSVFDDVLGSLFSDSFPTMLRQSTEGYPVADIYRDDGGDTVMEFALAGFNKEELSIDIQPGKRSITVKASSSSSEGADNRRIARRSFQKTFVNYDDNLDLTNASAAFENGLLTVMVPQRPEVTPLQLEIK